MTIRPLASCHLACTGTTTGKRLPRRCSVFGGGGVISSSTREFLSEKRSARSIWRSAKNGARARLITGRGGGTTGASTEQRDNYLRVVPPLRINFVYGYSTTITRILVGG